MAAPNPLTPEDCHVLNTVAQACADTRELIEKCKKIGLPVEEAEEKNEAHAKMVAALKREFFPNNA